MVPPHRRNYPALPGGARRTKGVGQYPGPILKLSLLFDLGWAKAALTQPGTTTWSEKQMKGSPTRPTGCSQSEGAPGAHTPAQPAPQAPRRQPLKLHAAGPAHNAPRPAPSPCRGRTLSEGASESAFSGPSQHLRPLPSSPRLLRPPARALLRGSRSLTAPVPVTASPATRLLPPIPQPTRTFFHFRFRVASRAALKKKKKSTLGASSRLQSPS